MKTQINVMKLAWKIFKSSSTIKLFSFALRLAWKIVKRCKVETEDSKIIIKGLNKLNLFIARSSDKIRNAFIFDDNDYNMNLFSYEMKGI